MLPFVKIPLLALNEFKCSALIPIDWAVSVVPAPAPLPLPMTLSVKKTLPVLILFEARPLALIC